MERAMTNITTESKRASEIRRRSAVRKRVLPDKLEVPATGTFSVLNPPTVVVLDTPNAIFGRPSGILRASHIQARNSTAQMQYHTYQQVNPTDYVAVGFHFW